MQHNIFFMPLLAVFSLLVIAGCNNPDARFARIEGTITYNGEAVEGASVVFAPASEGTESASGITDANGRFTLTTAGAHNVGSGVVPGEYTVLVSKLHTTQVTDPDVLAHERGEINDEELQRRLNAKGGSRTTVTRQHMLPERYSHPGQSPFTVTVSERRNPPFEFALTDE